MLIKFMADFQGRETKERFFEKGEIAEIVDDEIACDLVRRNVAQVVDEPVPAKVEAPKKAVKHG